MKTSLPRDSSPQGFKRKCLAFLIWSAALGIVGAACVETAECDETVSCGGNQACYELKCRPTCANTSDCESGLCLPCREELPGGVVQHCFDDAARACVDE